MSKRYLALLVVFVLALCSAPSFAQAAAAASDACLCTCKSPHHSSVEQYYELDANGGCNISGACVNNGERGTLSNCVKAPKPVTTTAALATMSTEEFLAYLDANFGAQ